MTQELNHYGNSPHWFVRAYLSQKKKENHHDNPVKGEWFLLCIELVV